MRKSLSISHPALSTIAALTSLAFAVACSRAQALPGRCDMVADAAPSVSVMHVPDTTRTRLAIAVTTPFPFHEPLGAAEVLLYADTLAARATTPLRRGTSDASGHVEVDGVPAGRYGLRARRAGAEEYFAVVSLRGSPADSLEIRLVTRDKICY